MNVFGLSWRYLWSRPLATTLNLLLLALGLAYGLLPCVLKLLAGLALYAGLMRRPDLISGPELAHPSAHPSA